MKKKFIIFVSIISTILIIVLSTFFIYTSSYSKADDYAKTYLSSSENLEYIEEDNYLIFNPNSDNVDTGFIFYPGAKVEYKAYSPLFYKLANEGFLCIICKMPYNLAFFGINNADYILNKYKNIDNWYIAGHSLGGVAASSYLYNHQEDFLGLILLASYTTKDFSKSTLKFLSIYGSLDEVLNKDAYNKNLKKLPSSYKEVVIEGGNHANFGSYGSQKGDGTAIISNDEQIEQTINIILEFIS